MLPALQTSTQPHMLSSSQPRVSSWSTVCHRVLSENRPCKDLAWVTMRRAPHSLFCARSQPCHIITIDNFAPELVKELRGVFDERFADPRRTHPQVQDPNIPSFGVQ